jgi:hypothetical protein
MRSLLPRSISGASRQSPDTVKQRDFNVILVKIKAFDGRVALQRANECLRTNTCNVIFRQVHMSERGAGQEWTVLHKLRDHKCVMHAIHDMTYASALTFDAFSHKSRCYVAPRSCPARGE